MLINVYVEYNRLRNTFTYSCEQDVEVGCNGRSGSARVDLIDVLAANRSHNRLPP